MTSVIVIVMNKKDDYRVANGRLVVEAGETVFIHNYAGAPASIKFNDGNPFGKDFTLGNGEIKMQDKLKPGCYPYSVTVNGKDAHASKPIIIVYP